MIVANPFPIIACPEPPAWDPADAAAWRMFLASPTGQKLKANVQFYEQAQNRSAVLLGAPYEHRMGFAQGWHKASVHYFETLPALVAPQTDDDTGQGDEASQLRERLAP